MTIYERVGSRIKEACLRKNVTAKQLAGLLGYSTASISNYERAKRWISLVDLERIAEFLGESLSYFIEETPSKKGGKAPQPLAERKILKALKNLRETDPKKLAEKVASLSRKTLEAKYTVLFLMNNKKDFEFGCASGIKSGLRKKLEDLFSTSAANVRFCLGNKLKIIFKSNKNYFTSDIAALISENGVKRLSPLTPSLLSLAKFETVMLMPLKTNYSLAGLLIACFEKTGEAERWMNSELLFLFKEYIAQLLGTVLLLEEVKTQRVRAS